MRDSCRLHFDHSFQLLEFGHFLEIEPSYLRKLVDKYCDDPEQFLVEVIHHWLQKHPEPNWMRLKLAMDEILEGFPSHHRRRFAVHHALQTLREEYEG